MITDLSRWLRCPECGASGDDIDIAQYPGEAFVECTECGELLGLTTHTPA